uniref:Uncharacterized protein n=1 Tax=Vitis vinifera TaxID=29760 RepID=A5AK29_VITVI|nr:hypothetical protein VITISV_034911 [Vitis vinifera]
MAILDSDGGGGSYVAGTIGEVPGVAGGTEDATSSIGPVEGTVGVGALMSAGGMASGCEGSFMESCPGTTLGALWRLEGDRALAPQVLAMADVKKLENGWPEKRAYFVAKSQFRSQGAFLQPISQLRNGGVGLRNGTRVPRRVLGLGNEALEDFAAVSQLQNGGLGCEMALMCQRGVSQLQKFSHGVGLGLRNDFVEEGLFCSETSISKRVVLGCEIIS